MKTDTNLLDRAAHAARELTGLTCEISGKQAASAGDSFDGRAQLNLQGHKAHRSFVVRRSVNPTVLHLLSLLKKESKDGLLLVTSQVTDRQAEILRKAGVEFMDEAGNVSLSGPGLHIMITGRRMPRSPLATTRPRAFNPAGLKLLYAFLTDPQLDEPKPGSALVSRTYRDIGAATGIAHSTVGWIMADLIRQGYVVEVDDGIRLLVERRRLLERWSQGYAETLRPKLLLERYRPARGDWWRQVTPEGGLWSGEVGSALLNGILKPGTFTIFGNRPSHAFILAHGLQKDPKGSVEYLSPFWLAGAAIDSAPLVHPLLIYADLLTMDDDRTQEAAQAVYDQHLRTIIETA